MNLLTFSETQDITNVIKTTVKVKGLGRNSSYLAGFSISFSWFYEKVQSLGKKKKLLKIFLSKIKVKVAIKFPFFGGGGGIVLALKGLKS